MNQYMLTAGIFLVLVLTCGCLGATVQPLHHPGSDQGIPPGDFPGMTTGGHVIALAVQPGEIDTPYPEAADLLIEGLALNANGNRFIEAIESYDRALAIDPDFAIAWQAKGVALHNLGRYDEAIACYDRALSLEPGNEGIEELKEISIQDRKRSGAG